MYIPEDVDKIIKTIEEAGFEAYAVGGCVRDSLLGIEPKDWDITTSAKPEEIKQIFPRTVDTGIEHGTVSVLIGKTPYEVTTYRLDGVYSDGRHPDKVEFSSSLAEDLKRRDFTINAMAYSKKTGVVDLFGGKQDLQEGYIRCVGNPMERFSEDALRMLRAIRFGAKLNFTIEEKTYLAIGNLKENLAKISKERIFIELNKTLESDLPQRLIDVKDTGLADFISPLFSQVDKRSYQGLDKLKGTPKHLSLRWAAFLYLIGEEKAIAILKDLKSDNENIRIVKYLIRYIDYDLDGGIYRLKILLNRIDYENLKLLLELKAAGFGKELSDILRIRKNLEQIIENKEAYRISDLAISGKDLISLGIKQGKQIGDTLDFLLDEVMKNPKLNQKEILKDMVKKHL